MYCSQECLDRDFRLVHRFECPIAGMVQHLTYGFISLGTKLFFYGLSLFNDDLDEMMRYCNRTKTEGNPLKLDYPPAGRVQRALQPQRNNYANERV